MSNTKQIIITLNAKSLFDYFPKKPTENDRSMFQTGFLRPRSQLRGHTGNHARRLSSFSSDL